MSGFVDFAELKERTSFAQVITLLGLQFKQTGNQWRGPCPSCQKGGERALVITEGKGFFCFAKHSGGDQIALAAHVKDCSVKDAALFIAKNIGKTVPDTVPKKEGEEGGRALQPLAYLEHDHDAVVAIGFDPEKAKSLGIGYAPKGLMRGTVAIPVRDENGVLQGYVGVEDCRLPPDFMTNVVSFDKKRA